MKKGPKDFRMEKDKTCMNIRLFEKQNKKTDEYKVAILNIFCIISFRIRLQYYFNFYVDRFDRNKKYKWLCTAILTFTLKNKAKILNTLCYQEHKSINKGSGHR